MKRACLLILLVFAIAQAASAQSSSSSPETGHKVLGSYFASDIDSVSLSNGNLHVGIPLFSLPGRELPVSLGVSYDSQFFERRTLVDERGRTLTDLAKPGMWCGLGVIWSAWCWRGRSIGERKTSWNTGGG
jgi:hypothetical protein